MLKGLSGDECAQTKAESRLADLSAANFGEASSVRE